MSCDPQTLLAQAACFQCVPAGQRELLELALLCNIMAGGGTGGGGGNAGASQDIVDPVAAPANPAITSFYVNTAIGSLWYWKIIGQVWVQII